MTSGGDTMIRNSAPWCAAVLMLGLAACWGGPKTANTTSADNSGAAPPGGPGPGAPGTAQPAGPWAMDMTAGLWRMDTAGTSARPGGGQDLMCHGPGDRGVFAPAQTGNGTLTCQDQGTLTADATGWRRVQRCASEGRDLVITYAVEHQNAQSFSAAMTMNLADGSPAMAPLQMDSSRISDCPADWRPGDQVDVKAQNPDGSWTKTNQITQTQSVITTLPPGG